jgi:hypothetical protein
MVRMRTLLVVAFLLRLDSLMAQTQSTENTWVGGEGFVRPACQVDSLGWLAGSWYGTGLGGECEELWGKPRAGAILGAFRLWKDGKTVFTEHFVLVEENATLVLKLKHFDPGMRGWEEKDRFVTFPLVKSLEREARFDGITYRLVNDKEMHVYVAIENKEKKVEEAKFVFQRE